MENETWLYNELDDDVQDFSNTSWINEKCDDPWQNDELKLDTWSYEDTISNQAPSTNSIYNESNINSVNPLPNSIYNETFNPLPNSVYNETFNPVPTNETFNPVATKETIDDRKCINIELNGCSNKKIKKKMFCDRLDYKNKLKSLDYNTSSKKVFDNFENLLNNRTSCVMKQSLCGQSYLSIPDVLKYLTFGGQLNNKDSVDLDNYIKSKYLDDDRNNMVGGWPKILINSKWNPLLGRSDKINIRKYDWLDYNRVAIYCLEWYNINIDRVLFN